MAKDTAIVAAASRTAAALVDWNDPKMQLQIKEAYGKNLNEGEWKLFMGLGIATGLNPFLREIWAVKYGNNAASVFVGRDGYRRSAQSHPEYEYHYAMAVHANDQFDMRNGEIDHSVNVKDRGALVGAYCVVKRKSASKPVVTYIDVKEYKQTYGVWATKPATMAVKVAEAQGLRASFQELFAGTYEESENWEQPKTEDATPPAKDPMAPLPGQTSIVDTPPAPAAQEPRTRRGRPSKKTVAADSNVIDAEVVPPPTTPVADAKPFFDKENPAPEAPAEQPSTFKNIMQNKAPGVPEDAIPPAKIRTDQTKKLFAVWGEYKKIVKMDEAQSSMQRKKLMKDMFQVESSVALNELQADELIARIEDMSEMARDEYTNGELASRAAGESF